MRAALIGIVVLLLAGQAGAAGPGPAVPWEAHSGGIVGRVFYDSDSDGRWSEGDQGLADVRLYTASGEAVVTDKDGRFHIFVLTTGNELDGQVLKLDKSTLPSGAAVVGSHRRLIRQRPGEIVRVDFTIRPPVPGTIDTRGLKPPGRDVPALLRPEKLEMVTNLAGKTDAGCRVSVDGRPVEVGDNNAYRTEVRLRPGVNPYLVATHCDDGHLEFLLAEIHWVQRATGGDLVVPARPRTLAACHGPPPGTIDFTKSVDLICRLEPGADFTLAGRTAEGPRDKQRSLRALLDVVPGSNRFEVTASFGDAQGLRSQVTWDISYVRWTGALIGALALRFGDQANVIGGKLRGQLHAELPRDFKLVLGGGVDSSGLDGLTVTDFLEAAWDPSVHERSPDPERGFLSPGDSSLVSDDNPASARYLLRLKRKSSLLGFGGFETHEGSTAEIGNYRRALQGAHFEIHPFEDFFEGPRPSFDLSLEGFYSPHNPHTETMATYQVQGLGAYNRRPAHDEFLATGGTLYFLGHDWVAEGSERLQVHLRDTRTGLTLERRTLRRGIDYQVDWASGRVLLSEPLDSGIMNANAVRLVPTGLMTTVLVADYEHLDFAVPGEEVWGGRSSISFRPAGGVIVSGAFETISQHATDNDYSLYKGETRVRFGAVGEVWAGYAKSDGVALAPAYSVDGGISFKGIQLADPRPAEAMEAGATLDLPAFQGTVRFRRYLTGYSDTSILAWRDLTQVLVSATGRPADFLEIFGRFVGAQQKIPEHQEDNTYFDGSLGLRLRPLDDLVITVQGAMDLGSGGYFRGGFTDSHRALAGLRLAYRVTSWLTLLAGHQHTLLTDGEGPASRDLTLTTGGGEVALGESHRAGVEAGWGPEVGNVVRLSLTEDRADGGAVFAHTTFSLDRDAMPSGQLVTGQSVPAGGGAQLTSAQTMTADRSVVARGQQVGISVPISRPWRLKFAYERSELDSPGDDDRRLELLHAPFFDRGAWDLTRPGRRNAVFGRLAYVTQPLALAASAEYRVDEHLPLAEQISEDTTHRQTVLSLAARWNISKGLQLGGRIAWGETFGQLNGADGPGRPEGGFLEGNLSLSYRPADLDWIRFLLRAGAGANTRPQEVLDVQGNRFNSPWMSGSLAVLMHFTQYFQPAIVVAPWLGELQYSQQATGQKQTYQVTQLVGMLRVGSELYAGLGIAGELRLSNRKPPDIVTIPPDFKFPEGWAVGAAAELFYQLDMNEYGGLRIGLGYSFSDIADPLVPMSDLPASGSKGLFLRLEGIL